MGSLPLLLGPSPAAAFPFFPFFLPLLLLLPAGALPLPFFGLPMALSYC